MNSLEVRHHPQFTTLLLSNRDDVDIRVVPVHGVRLGGQFTVMEHKAYPPVVHAELEAVSVLLDAPDVVEVYRARLHRLHRLRAAALDRQRSREVLFEIADRFGVRDVESVGAAESAWLPRRLALSVGVIAGDRPKVLAGLGLSPATR